jgi:hypothetical protein
MFFGTIIRGRKGRGLPASCVRPADVQEWGRELLFRYGKDTPDNSGTIGVNRFTLFGQPIDKPAAALWFNTGTPTDQLLELAALVFFFGTGVSELLYDPFFARFVQGMNYNAFVNYINEGIQADDSNNWILHYTCAICSDRRCTEFYSHDKDVWMNQRNAAGFSPLSICVARNAYVQICNLIRTLEGEDLAFVVYYVLALIKMISLLAEDGVAREVEAWRMATTAPVVGWGSVALLSDTKSH